MFLINQQIVAPPIEAVTPQRAESERGVKADSGKWRPNKK